ncbi:MAG: YncE family protein [Actinomycetota bacterium]
MTGLAATDSHPAHVVGTPDGGVLVTSSGQPSLFTYDARLRPRSRTELDGAPHGLRLSADGGTAVVANTGAGTLDVVAVTSGAVRDRVDVGPGPVQAAVSPDGRWAWASVARQVVEVDLAAAAVVERSTVDAAPAQVFLTSTGRLLVAGQGDEGAPGSTLTVLDASTLERLAEVEVGSRG